MIQFLLVSLLLRSWNMESAKPLRNRIVKAEDPIVPHWHGGPGIFQLFSRPDAALGPWRAVHWLVTQMEMSVSSGRPGDIRQPSEGLRHIVPFNKLRCRVQFS